MIKVFSTLLAHQKKYIYKGRKRTIIRKWHKIGIEII